MNLTEKDLPLEQELLRNLRNVYAAKDNETLQQASAWLRDNHSRLLEMFARVLAGPQECTFSGDVVATQQAVCTHLRRTWQQAADEEALCYGLRVLSHEQLHVKVAREFCQAFAKVLRVLPYTNKKALLGQTLKTLQNCSSLSIVVNLLILLNKLIKTFDSFQLMEVFSASYEQILQLTAGIFRKTAEQQRQVVAALATEEFDQRQMAVFELLLEASNECVATTINFLEGANQEQTMYFEVLSRLHGNSTFREAMVQAACMNQLGVFGVVWRSPLKQAVVFNRLKSHLMRVINEVYPEPLEELFQPVLAAIMEHDNRESCQEVRSVLFDCFVILERFVAMPQKYSFFSKVRIELMYCLLRYCIANRDEYHAMEENPEQFVEMARRCCEQDQFSEFQEQQELKEKAMMVLLVLTHLQDGLLPRITQTLLIMVDASLMRQEEHHERFESFREEFDNNGFALQKVSQAERIECSLLVLSALHTQLLSRVDLKMALHRLMEYRFEQISKLPPICVNRLVLLVSYNPILVCFRHFPEIAGRGGAATKMQIAEAFATILACKVKPEMKEELLLISLQLISRISCLDKAFEVVVERHFDLIDTVEARTLVLQRLVRELQINYQHRPENMLSNINRLSVMMRHFFERVSEPTTYEGELLPALQLVLLHPDCQQSIIEVAVGYLDRCQHVTPSQRKFLGLALQTIERNDFVLNSCFDLFYRHLLYSNFQEDREVIVRTVTRCIELSTVEVDMWELGQLCELAILTSKQLDESLREMLGTLHKALLNDSPQNVGSVLSEVYLCFLYQYKQQAVEMLGSALDALLDRFLTNHTAIHSPQLKKVHCLYLLELLELQVRRNHSQSVALLNLVLQIMESLLPDRMMQPEQASPSDVYQICLNQKLRELEGKHPLYRADVFELLEEKWRNFVRLNAALAAQPELHRALLTKLLACRTIDNTVRSVHRIKR